MKLVKPTLKYHQSYCDYIEELKGEERYPFPLDFAYENFQNYLTKVENLALGKNLPDGFVASSTFWLVDNGQIVGVTNVRHELSDKILHCGGHIGLSVLPSKRGKALGDKLMELSLIKLREIGVNKVHIHCYKTNHASAKIIINNGGVLDSEVEDNGQIVQRFIVSEFG